MWSQRSASEAQHQHRDGNEEIDAPLHLPPPNLKLRPQKIAATKGRRLVGRIDRVNVDGGRLHTMHASSRGFLSTANSLQVPPRTGLAACLDTNDDLLSLLARR